MDHDTYREKTAPLSFFSLIARIADKQGDKQAITEECGLGSVSRSYDSLIKDAKAAAEYIEERASPSTPIRIRGGGAYDKAVLILAASYSGRQVVIERGYLTSEPRTELTLKNGESFTITFEELRPLISGILALPLKGGMSKSSGTEITFATPENGNITYSEDAVILSALTFGPGAALSGRDRLMYFLDEDTPEGLFCGLIAPLIFGGCAIGCHTLKHAMRTIRDISPTKILCYPKVAEAMLLKMKKIKKREPHPLIIRRREGGAFEGFDVDPTRVLIRRLASPRVASAFGGRLRSVIVWGELPEAHIDRFFSFGIYAVTVLSEPGLTPSLFHYGGDKRGVWRLPEGVYADVCNVQKGGIGNFMFYSHAICRGKESADTLVPGEIRCDALSGQSALISGMRGFLINDSKIFITER